MKKGDKVIVMRFGLNEVEAEGTVISVNNKSEQVQVKSGPLSIWYAKSRVVKA